MKWYVFRVWQNRYRITYFCILFLFVYFVTTSSSPRQTHAAQKPIEALADATHAEKVVEKMNQHRLGVEARIVPARNNVNPDNDNDNHGACHMQNVSNPSKACKQYCINKHPRTRGCFCAKMVGYSQFGQDLLLLQYLKSKGLSTHNKFFVDIGAYDGVWSSNTYLLERCFGWQGVCIEAEPENFKDLISDKNPRTCTKVHVAMGKYVAYANILHSRTVSTIMVNNTQRRQRAGTVQSSIVPMTTLNRLLHAFNIRFVDFMSMDIEGAEEDVIKSSGLGNAHIDTLTVEVSNSDSTLQSVIMNEGYTIYKTFGEENVLGEKSVFFYKI